MEGNEIAIPFDINSMHENVFHKLLRHFKTLIKYVLRRTIDITFSIIGIKYFSIITIFQILKKYNYC